MATKRPICLYNGAFQELQSSDTLPGGGGSSKFRIGLSPAAAELVGGTDEPFLVGVASVTADYTHWSELRYNDTTIQEAMWNIGSVITKDYAGGNITTRIRWIAAATSGAVKWQVRLVCATAAGVTDKAFDATSHTVTPTVAGTTLQMNTSDITFTPAGTELTAGYTWWIALRRVASDGADTMTGDAKVFDFGVFEV